MEHPEGITVVSVFVASEQEFLNAAKELFPGNRVTGVPKEIDASE
jgi:hypothetical protein